MALKSVGALSANLFKGKRLWSKFLVTELIIIGADGTGLTIIHQN
jgi:hypothetical protein